MLPLQLKVFLLSSRTVLVFGYYYKNDTQALSYSDRLTVMHIVAYHLREFRLETTAIQLL